VTEGGIYAQRDIKQHRNTNDRKKSTQKGRQQMKKMKKVISLALSFIMVIAMAITTSVTASAADSDTIIINADNSGRQLQAFQIFTSDVTGESKVVSNPKWTTNVDSTQIVAFINDLKTDDVFSTTTGDSKSYWFSGVTAEATGSSASAVIALLQNTTYFPNNSETTAKHFAEVAGKYFGDTTKVSSSGVYTFTEQKKNESDTTYTYKLTGLTSGYYVIKDAAGSVKTGDAYSEYMLQIVGDTKDVTINVKADAPAMSKEVTKTETEFNNKKAVDADVNETVYFKLDITMPSTVANYKQYKVSVRDTLSDGLTLGEITDVHLEFPGQINTNMTVDAKGTSKGEGDNATTVQYGYKVEKKDSNELIISFDDLNEIIKAGNTSDVDLTLDSKVKVVIKYSAHLNENAFIGGSGNANTAKLYYTNNPYDTFEGYPIDDPDTPGNPDPEDPEGGDGPEQHAYVFTYKLEGNKISLTEKDNDGNPVKLQGAEFILYKGSTLSAEATTAAAATTATDASANNDSSATTEAAVTGTDRYYASAVDNNGKVTAWTKYTAAQIKEWEKWYEGDKSEDAPIALATFTSGADGVFNVAGISDGGYNLREIKAPTSYNKLTSDIHFAVDATWELDTTSKAYTTKTLSVTLNNDNTQKTASAGNDITNGIVKFDVKNGVGNSLPKTGGMGRTIIYALGALLVLGAAIQLVVRKRMSIEK
jgi:fimbrial isopeptide formation D2 family protein